MVKLAITALISILSLGTFGLSAPSCYCSTHIQRSGDTLVQINTDIANISSQVATLSTNINTFPASGGNLANALGISNEALTISKTLGNCAADVISNGPIALSDGTSILNSVQSLSDPIHNALIAIVNKKSAFTGLGVGNVTILIGRDLHFLRGNASNLGNALITFNAPQLSPSATALRDTILKDFDVAIAAYSTSTR